MPSVVCVQLFWWEADGLQTPNNRGMDVEAKTDEGTPVAGTPAPVFRSELHDCKETFYRILRTIREAGARLPGGGLSSRHCYYKGYENIGPVFWVDLVYKCKFESRIWPSILLCVEYEVENTK